MPPLFEVTGFDLRDDAQFSVALPELQLAAGGRAALFGPSGSGKSSLLAAMFGLLMRPGWHAAGRVSFRGADLANAGSGELLRLRRRELVFLMQDAHAALDPLVPVGRQVAEAAAVDREAVLAMWRRLGLGEVDELWARHPHRISGGQAQRVALSIAFLRRPALVIADEPSASLDGGSYAELLAQLRELVAAGSALLLATHDQRLLRDLDADVYVHTERAFVRAAVREAPWPARPRADFGTAALVSMRGVHLAYGARTVLDRVDLELRRGEVVAVLGESGAGKTTLLRVLAGHLAPDGGEVERPPRRVAVQLVCQDAYGSLTPGRRLDSLLAEARAPFFDPAAGADSVQLPEVVLQRTAARMSGGERRRAALLRALAVQPDVLLLDEPTASLDRAAATHVIERLLVLQRSRALALLLVTHDEELAAAVAHRVLRMQGGRLCAC